MGGKKPLRRPLWPPTRATASNYYPLGLDGAGGAAKPLLRAPKKPAPLHGRLPAFSGAVDAFERARKCFLEWRYFFSIILSEFLKNRVALQPLHTEIEQCCNYAELSSVGQNDPVEVVCEIDPELSELPLPPVSLLTLVENSVKHGKMIGKTLKITITAKLLETEEGCMADLSVADNGTGFTAGDLKQLNSAAPQEENGQHVGLFNVVRRLQLLYGEQAAIAFTNNRRGGGARVELFLPIDPVLQKKEGETA